MSFYGYLGLPDPAVPRGKHLHLGHECFFEGCPFTACKRVQKQAELYGFTAAGEINVPPKRSFPWESAA